MIGFFFFQLLELSSSAEKRNFSICVTYPKIDKSFCPKNVDAKFAIKNKKNSDEEFSNWTVENNYNKFSGIDYLTIYVDCLDAKTIPIALDIYAVKDAKHIIIMGPNPQNRSTFTFNVNNITTFDDIELNNIVAVKDATTKLFINKFTLVNTRFSGFNKAAVFFGLELNSDLNSVSNTTFKFDTVNYNCKETEIFAPNYEYDGCIFTTAVTFTGFNTGASLYQYGSDFIIIPSSLENGFRKTNFRQLRRENITYNVKMNDGELLVGCYFSNKASSFNNIRFDLVNAKLQILDGQWNGDAFLSVNLVNSDVNVHTKDVQIKIIEQPIKSTLNTDLDEVHINYVDSQQINGLSFSDNFTIDTLFVKNFTEIKINANKIAINTLTSDHQSNVTFSGGKVYFRKIDSYFNWITVENLGFTPEGVIIINNEVVPHIISLNPVIDDIETKFTFVSEKEMISKFELLNIPNSSTIRIQYRVEDNILPFFLNTTITENSKIYKTQVSGNGNLYCVSDISKDKCGMKKISSTTFHELSKFYKLNKLLYSSAFVTIYLNSTETLYVDLEYPLSKLKVVGLLGTENCKVSLANYTTVKHIILENVTLEVNSSETTYIEELSIINCIVPTSISKCSFGDLIIDGDSFTRYGFNRNSNITKSLTVHTENLYMAANGFSPDIPLVTESLPVIKVRDVSLVSRQGGFNGNRNVILEPKDKLEFTTNNYGNIKFTIRAQVDCVITFKAFFPADIDSSDSNVQYTLIPKFWGSKLTTARKFCSRFLKIAPENEITVVLDDDAYKCSGFTTSGFSFDVITDMPVLTGVSHLHNIVINKTAHIDIGTYVEADTLFIPFDDFLLHVKWDLKNAPLIMVHNFSAEYASAYNPFIEVFPENPVDFETFNKSANVFKFGIPVFCVESSDYPGYISTYGNLVYFNDTVPLVTTTRAPYGVSNLPDSCIKIIPYEPNHQKKTIRGPVNKKGWIGIIVISFLIMLAIIVLFSMSYICPKKVVNTNQNIVLGVLE